MHSGTMNPDVSFFERITLYRQYALESRRTGHKPVSFFAYLKGLR